MNESYIDVTGAVLAPGTPDRCQGNGSHPQFECCCDNCDYFIQCFPEYQKEVDEARELLRNRAAYDRATKEHKKNSVTYTHDEVKKMFE